MASTSIPRILLMKQSGATAIAKGVAVKMVSTADVNEGGAVNGFVTPCTASTDAGIGLSQGVSANAGDFIEVALPGGGGKGLAHGTIHVGQLLVPFTDGSLQPTTGAGDRVVAVALDEAVAGDIFATEVVIAVASGASN